MGFTGLIQSKRIVSTKGVGIAMIAGNVVIRSTYPGDANLDRMINGDDFFAIDSGYASHTAGYGSGDFDYNGRIDADDYFLIDSNYSKAQTPLAAAGVVQPSEAHVVQTDEDDLADARLIQELD
jgi:hypothetical protein